MGLISQAVERAIPITRAPRTGAIQTTEGTVATVGGMASMRQVGPQGVSLYRTWATQGELVRSAIDHKLGQLTKAEWDLVPFQDNMRAPDKGLMRRMREILSQPNPGEDGLDTFFQQLGEDLYTLDAGPFEKERIVRGEIVYLWPVDGAHIKVDRFWNGDPRSPRYFYVPRPDVSVPFLNMDLGYTKVHHRTYSPMGVPPLETLKNVITAELNGSMYNDRQVTQAAPDGIMDLGENARPDQVEAFKALWNTLIAGKSMMAFWGGTKSAKFIPFKVNNREMQFIEWQEYLVRKLCAVFHLSPQDLGFSFDINKSTGEVQQGITDDRSLYPLMRVQSVMTSQFCWDPAWGGMANNIAFRFTAVTDRQSKALAETQKLSLAGLPSETVNEARKKQGKPPIGDPADPDNVYNKLMANTPQGMVLLEDVMTARELANRKVAAPTNGAPKQIPASTQKADVDEAASRGVLAAIRAMSDPPTVNVEAPSVTVQPADVIVESPDVIVDTSGFEKSIAELRAVVLAQPKPTIVTRREVVRDANGRIVEVIDHREEA